MSRVWLLRHAKAEPPEEGQRDHERPLADKGRRGMADIAAWAKAQDLGPDLVLCSTSARTRETAELLAPSLPGAPQIRYEEGLYLATAAELASRIRRISPKLQGVMLIGHNPGLQELAVALMPSGAGVLARRLKDGMPTGALAVFELDGPWSALGDGAGRLVHFVTPKELRG